MYYNIQFVNIALSLKVVLTQLTPSVYTQIFSFHSAKLKVSVKTVCVQRRNVLIHILTQEPFLILLYFIAKN